MEREAGSRSSARATPGGLGRPIDAQKYGFPQAIQGRLSSIEAFDDQGDWLREEKGEPLGRFRVGGVRDARRNSVS